MPQMTIALGLNEENLLPTLITIRSVMEHTAYKEDISFTIFSDGVNRHATNLVKDILTRHGHAHSFVNLHDLLAGFAYGDIIRSSLLYPLLIPQYFTSKDFVLSLGTHSFVRGDVLTLLDGFPEDRKIGAVRCMMHGHRQYGQFYGLDHEATHVLGLDNPRDYFSRNLLLFNREAISPVEGQACIQLLDEGWRAQDEAILNHLFHRSCHLFPQEWNVQMDLLQEPDDAFHDPVAQELARGRNAMKLCQFSSPMNPEEAGTALERMDGPVQEYRKTAAAVMQDVRHQAPHAMFGSMWNTLLSMK